MAAPAPFDVWFLDVCNFGAVGDGVADDTNAVRNAIAAIPDSELMIPNDPKVNTDLRVLGATVIFPPGSYRITQPIVVQMDNVTFRGAGRATTHIRFDPAIPQPFAFEVLATPNSPSLSLRTRRCMHFADLSFSHGGIHLERGLRHHSSIRGCMFIATPAYAIDCDPQTITLEISDCMFRSCAGGVHIDGPSSDLVTIQRCSFLYGKAYDLRLRSSSITVDACDFEVRPTNYTTSADAYILLEPADSEPFSSVHVLLLTNNRFGAEEAEPGNGKPFEGDIHGAEPPYAIRVGGPAFIDGGGVVDDVRLIGNYFSSLSEQVPFDSPHGRRAHIRLDVDVRNWVVAENWFDAPAVGGFIIEERDWPGLVQRGVHGDTSGNVLLHNRVERGAPFFSAGGVGWPTVRTDPRTNPGRSRETGAWEPSTQLLNPDIRDWIDDDDVAVTPFPLSAQNMPADSFLVVSDKASVTLQHLHALPIEHSGPWCFSVWFQAGTIDGVRLHVWSRTDDPNAASSEARLTAHEAFTRTQGDWHLLVVAVGFTPPFNGVICRIALGAAAGGGIGWCALRDPRFERGMRPRDRWVHRAKPAPIFPIEGELWINDDRVSIPPPVPQGAQILSIPDRRLNAVVAGRLYGAPLLPPGGRMEGDVRWHGAVGDGVADDSAAFQRAIDASLFVFVPPGQYRVRDLVLRKRTNIVCAGEAAEILGFRGIVTPDDGEVAILRTDRHTVRVRIHGGTWRDADLVWDHGGDESLANCVFHDMRIQDVGTAFRLSTSVSNTWRDCHFGTSSGPNNVGRAIHFLGTGEGQTNANLLDGCRIALFADDAVAFMGESRVGPGAAWLAIDNAIRGCTFEGSRASAIRVQGDVRTLHIQDCYFEDLGAPGRPDIVIDGSFGEISGLVVESCSFALSAPNPPGGTGPPAERIGVYGHADLRAIDNHAVLRTDAFAPSNPDAFGVQRFVTVSGPRAAPVIHLHRNRLRRHGPAPPDRSLLAQELWLFANDGGDRRVAWSLKAGGETSGFTGGAEARAVLVGQRVPEVHTLERKEIPSVRRGHVFRAKSRHGTRPPITFFDGGMKGQTIRIVAEEGVLVRHDVAKIRLQRGQDFQMAIGDTLTLTMYCRGVWTEDARSANHHSP